MRGRRASICVVLAATVLAGCGDPPTPPDPSPTRSSSPPPPAADGWTARAVGGLAGARTYGLQIAPSTTDALVVGTMVATVGSTKGHQDIGVDAAYHWRCTESSCRSVSGSVRPTDRLDAATTGFTATSGSAGTVQVTRCTEAGCDEAPTPHPTVYTGQASPLRRGGSDLAAFAADGEHLVVLSGSRPLGAGGTASVRISSCPAGTCATPAMPVAGVDYSYVEWYTAVAVRDGRVAFATATRDEQRRDDQPHELKVVSIQLCADPTCSRLGRRVDMTGVRPPRRLSLRILPDGRPVLLVERDLVICTDPNCSGIEIRPLVEAGPDLYLADPVLAIGRNGLPMVAVAHEGVWLHTCTDRMCTAPTKRLVSPVNPTAAQLAVADAADGTTYVAYITHKEMVLFRSRN